MIWYALPWTEAIFRATDTIGVLQTSQLEKLELILNDLSIQLENWGKQMLRQSCI